MPGPPAPSSSADSAGQPHPLDAELVQLSQLMQSLALHCHNLAFVKMYGGTPGGMLPGQPQLQTSSTSSLNAAGGDAEKAISAASSSTGITSSAALPAGRPMPRMGTGGANNGSRKNSVKTGMSLVVDTVRSAKNKIEFIGQMHRHC